MKAKSLKTISDKRNMFLAAYFPSIQPRMAPNAGDAGTNCVC